MFIYKTEMDLLDLFDLLLFYARVTAFVCERGGGGVGSKPSHGYFLFLFFIIYVLLWLLWSYSVLLDVKTGRVVLDRIGFQSVTFIMVRRKLGQDLAFRIAS